MAEIGMYTSKVVPGFYKATPFKSSLFPFFVLCPSFLAEGTKQTAVSRYSFVIVMGLRFDSG